MILTSEQANPAIEHATRTGEVISDDVAETIASWWHSPADADAPITRLSHQGPEGCDPVAIVNRLASLIAMTRVAETDVADLRALKAWALNRAPRLVVETFEISSDDWQKWSAGELGDGDRPDGVEGSEDVAMIDDYREDLGEWVSPGEPGYPDNPESHNGYDPEDGQVFVPASLVDTADAMLRGKGQLFWAGSAGGDPFNWGMYWEQADKHETGVGVVYASRYQHPYTGEVEIKLARLLGMTPEDEAAVYRKQTTRE